MEQISQLSAFTDDLLVYHRRATETLENLQTTLAARIEEAQSRPRRSMPEATIERKPSTKNRMKYEDPEDDTDNYSPVIPPSAPKMSNGTPSARAMFDFEAENDGELDFKEGDMITLTSQVDENWFEGELEGRSGLFPVGYVEVVVPL